MVANEPEVAPPYPDAPTVSPAPAGPIPSVRGRRVLLFEFVVLLEYFVAPAIFGVTNYAGLWSAIGSVLFVVLVASLLLLVVRPLLPRLKEAIRHRPDRLLFHLVWTVAFAAGLLLTNLVQLVGAGSPGPVSFGAMTVYTPLGAWPTLTIFVPPLGLWVALNVAQPTLLLLLSVLSAGSLVLARNAPCPAVPTERPPPRRRSRLSALGALSPLGLVTGCPTCFPAYFSLVALIAPGVASSAYVALPLVPWIGLAGLLYLLGFVLVTRSVFRATTTSRAFHAVSPA